jgi:DNA-binding GntR family transcriptional regulator
VKTSVDVEREIRERILRQEYLPGNQLREEPLAAEMGVTRNAVRSALIALEMKRLVQRIPNKGAIVARIGTERLLEIYDVLELLEGLTARLAASRSKPEDWEALIELFGDPLQGSIESGDWETYLAGIEQYRATANSLAGNTYLSELLSAMHDQANAIIRKILIIPGRAEQSLNEHRRLLQALKAGDAEKAEQVKRENMRTARCLLEKYSPLFGYQ